MRILDVFSKCVFSRAQLSIRVEVLGITKQKKSIHGRGCVVIRILWPVVPSNKERI
jgi:hypothetical protein